MKALQHWPFPPPTGPVPWTPKQIKQYEQQKRESAGEGLV
jgi:hypothetical protein